MKLTWDPIKARANLAKPGVRFSDAESVLFDPGALTREDEDTEGEPRLKKEYDFSKAKRGAVIPQLGKTRITIYIDDDVLQDFRSRADEDGRGYQTMMNEALREYLGKAGHPLDEEALRRILREELKSVV